MTKPERIISDKTLVICWLVGHGLAGVSFPVLLIIGFDVPENIAGLIGTLFFAGFFLASDSLMRRSRLDSYHEGYEDGIHRRRNRRDLLP